MEYSIHTLEIEIANLRTVLRKAHGTILSYEDSRGGVFPNTSKIRRNIKELEKAIEVLKSSNFEEPDPVELLED